MTQTPATTSASSNTARFFVPNKLNLQDIKIIEAELGKKQSICWVVEEGIPASADIFAHFQEQRAEGFLYNCKTESPSIIAQRIQDKLQQNKHLILLPTRPPINERSLHDLSIESLELINQLNLRVEPIYCYEKSTGEPDIHLLPSIAPSPATSAHLLSAWSEGSARELERYKSLQESNLAQLLLHALQDNSTSTIYNGIDDSSTTYQELLKKSLLCAKHLKKTYRNSKRIGILLPPSPDAICANIACIFAGLSPVNLNYKQSVEACQAQAQDGQIKRYITQKSTTNQFHKQSWINQRDLLYLDKIIEQENAKTLQFSKLGKMFYRSKNCLKSIDYRAPESSSEALLITSKGQEDSQVKNISLTHKQVLAQILQLEQQAPLTEPDSILCRHSNHQGQGLILGLILPILSGQHITTYPDEENLEQFLHLIQQRQIQLAHISPKQLHKLAQQPIKPQQLQSLQQLIVSGAPLHPQLKKYCEDNWGVKIYNAYSISQAGGLASIATQENSTETQQQTCSVGWPLHGTAIRIGNPYIQQRNIPLGELGGLWIKGPSINSRQWVETGDIASMSLEGQLHIYGRRQRFSRINGQLIPHQQVEQILYQFYKIEQSREPQLAIISITANDSEQLILLSTVHKDFSANDYITMRYGLSNQKYPREWCPNKVLYINKIPLLSNGTLDYKQSCKLSYQALGYKPAKEQ